MRLRFENSYIYNRQWTMTHKASVTIAIRFDSICAFGLDSFRVRCDSIRGSYQVLGPDWLQHHSRMGKINVHSFSNG